MYDNKEIPDILNEVAQERFTMGEFVRFTNSMRHVLDYENNKGAPYWQQQDITTNQLKIKLQEALLENDYPAVGMYAMQLFCYPTDTSIPHSDSLSKGCK